MATKYTFRCPSQSYSINLEMCVARQAKNVSKCSHCRNKPKGAQSCQGQT